MMKIMKKYGQDILVVLGTFLASGYVELSETMKQAFAESGNIYIPLYMRAGIPAVWGLYWGAALFLICRWKPRISPVSLLALAANLGISWYLWKTSYQISSYHLMLAGGLAAALLVMGLQRILKRGEEEK